MRIVVFDIETELIPKVGHKGINIIWCIVTKELGEEPKVWLEKDFEDFVKYTESVDLWVAHNGLSFDVPVVNRLLGCNIDPKKVVDTFVVSRLVNYSRFNTHSLEELGAYLKEPKTPFADFSCLSQEMIDYCVQDVRVTERVYEMYKKYIWEDSWSKAMRLEHDMVLINEDMSANGFKFNSEKAEELLAEITSRMATIEQEFQEVWPPWLIEVNRVQYRTRADGELFATTQRALDQYPKTVLEGTELVCYDYEKFNPGSTKHRVDKLWEAGWQPTERTKTHNEFLRARVGEMWRKSRLTPQLYAEKKEHFSHYGWVVGEENLLTLPEDAPEGARKLAEWLTLEGRRSSLTEWLQAVQEDGRIHGKFWFIGAWTHRMSHSHPNQANIFSPFHGEPRNAVEEVKAKYDRDLRALWCTDKVLVGTDADGIQLRILAHYMKSEEYRDAILSGRKEDETDIHNVNRRALGVVCRDRDVAKTFIYAWLLGAGTGKVCSILSTSMTKAKAAVNDFLESLPGLKKVKTGQIPRDARRGYFIGLDGRKVLCDSEHLMLAGYLQNGEAIAMKMWIRQWVKMAREIGLLFWIVDFVHDEVQVEVDTVEDGEKLIEIQKEAMKIVSEELNMFCPLEVSGSIGYNWAMTH